MELAAGRLVPADGTVLQAIDFFVNQALLIGEAAPVEKHVARTGARARVGTDDALTALQAPHLLYMGSSVVSGLALMRVDATGARTEFGRMAESLQRPASPTEFERGTRRFGMTLTRATVALVLAVLLLNVLYQRSLLESFLFAVALDVGLTPELLPMIGSVTLARGALRLARQRVVVRRLSAIQDLDATDVLCTDKTGTRTEATLRWASPATRCSRWPGSTADSRAACAPRGTTPSWRTARPTLPAGASSTKCRSTLSVAASPCCCSAMASSC